MVKAFFGRDIAGTECERPEGDRVGGTKTSASLGSRFYPAQDPLPGRPERLRPRVFSSRLLPGNRRGWGGASG